MTSVKHIINGARTALDAVDGAQVAETTESATNREFAASAALEILTNAINSLARAQSELSELVQRRKAS